MGLSDFFNKSGFTNCSRIYVYPNIPAKKLSNALASYKSNLAEDDVIVLIDNTMMGSGKDGALICRNGIVIRDSFDDASRYMFDTLDSIKIEGVKLYLDNKKVISFSMPNKSDIQRLFQLINRWHQDTSNISADDTITTENSSELTANTDDDLFAEETAILGQLILADEKSSGDDSKATTARNKLTGYVLTAIEDNKSKILPMLREKTGELSQSALRNDQYIERLASFIYAFLPGFVRLAVKEHQLVSFILPHRDKILDALFKDTEFSLAPVNIEPQLSLLNSPLRSSTNISDELDALFDDEDDSDSGAIKPDVALNNAILELRDEITKDPEMTFIFTHAINLASAVLDMVRKSGKKLTADHDSDVLAALSIMHGFSYHKIPDVLREDDKNDEFAMMFSIGISMLLDSYCRQTQGKGSAEDATAVAMILMKCASKDQLNMMIRTFIEDQSTFTAHSLFSPDDILQLLRQANQYASSWSKKLIAGMVADELAIQRKWGDLLFK
ncbi:hypothetical protein [Yersinia mollaretii]|uniref:hypothetical protein n=1 Tax=Yersinia mollaretii TaxID=33060 RepID=UPI0002ED4EAE|nr:hypothetical protein [Yersinia mollaretii]QKJ04889.1 hypothetical protein HRD69_18880 [Yersinia mollaretii ATCC 43969]